MWQTLCRWTKRLDAALTKGVFRHGHIQSHPKWTNEMSRQKRAAREARTRDVPRKQGA